MIRNIRNIPLSIKIVFICLLTLGTLYAAGVYYYRDHVLPNTVYNGKTISNMKFSKADDVLEKKMLDSTVKVEDSLGKTHELSYERLGLQVQADTVISKLEEKQNPYLFFMNFFMRDKNEEKIVMNIDNEVLKNTLQKEKITTKDGKKPSVNAKVERKETEYHVIDEKIGTELDETKAIALVEKAIQTGSEHVNLQDAIIQPTLKKETLVSAVASANNRIQVPVELTFGTEKIQVPETVRASWISVSEDGKVIVNNDSIASYVTELAQKKATTVTQPTKKLTTTYNADKLIQNIQNGLSTDVKEKALSYTAKSQTVEQSLVQQAKPTTNTYIEVNIASQHMWYYKDGKLVLEAPVVTGNVKNGWDTPKGEYAIWNKKEHKIMNGATVGFDYYTEVNYWMAIDYTGVGFHDAVWRNDAEYGKQTYLTNGSHGCVNLRLNDVRKLYSLVELKTKVYIT